MIEVKNIYQSYGKHEVLKDVSIKIKDNEITALIGPNGAGKSTLLGVISRLLKPTSGEVLIDGKNVNDIKNIDIAKRLAVLRQNNQIGLKLTVKELVSFGRYPHSGGRLTKEDEIKIKEAIEFMDLKDMENKFIDQMSGGQQQRAYIAMVLAQDTKYIFLDEPLNNLDMKYSVEMMFILEKLVKELNKTIVIVMHDINIASAFASHIVAMKDGKIITEGTPEEIIDKQVLDDVFDHDFCIAGINGKRICVYHNVFEELEKGYKVEEIK